MVIVRSYIPSIAAKLVWGIEVKLMYSYISSERIKMLGCWRNTFARASNSCWLYTEPVGLQGELNHTILVFSVIAPSNWAGVILKSFSIVANISTGVAPASFAISL